MTSPADGQVLGTPSSFPGDAAATALVERAELDPAAGAFSVGGGAEDVLLVVAAVVVEPAVPVVLLEQPAMAASASAATAPQAMMVLRGMTAPLL